MIRRIHAAVLVLSSLLACCCCIDPNEFVDAVQRDVEAQKKREEERRKAVE